MTLYQKDMMRRVHKDHREIAKRLIERPLYGGSWCATGTWWQPIEQFKLGILCEANSDIEASADALGRKPTTLAHRAAGTGLVLPKHWRELITPKRSRSIKIREQSSLLSYPYISKARNEHADLLAVNSIIPSGIPENMRADMCQEIMLALLEGRTTLEALKAKKANSAYFIKKFYHDNYEAGGHAISFQDTDEDWDSDAVASSVAAKEWRENQMRHDRGFVQTRTYTPPVQFQAAWQDQVGRTHLGLHQLGHFLSHDEVEELMEAESAD
jgi:hypothetical protein